MDQTCALDQYGSVVSATSREGLGRARCRHLIVSVGFWPGLSGVKPTLATLGFWQQ